MVIAPDDPSELGFPDTLPLEVALAERPVDAIFRAYGLDRLDYQRLCADPLFIRAVEEALDSLKKDGVTFKLKAKAQALVLLQTSFALIHDADTPASVKADMIKFTVRAAGLDASMDQKNANTLGGVNFQVVMNLGDN
jgi:hypothetical protein